MYTSLIHSLVPPVVPVDTDGVVVDWDKGFMRAWNLLFEEYNRRAQGPQRGEDGGLGTGSNAPAQEKLSSR